ncbi:polysaccharide biosynthesis C-terminal domain-containing protein [bacterium]|nr:polysaccharide biosynthesis C-terminal domain-containing protein [bacterium]
MIKPIIVLTISILLLKTGGVFTIEDALLLNLTTSIAALIVGLWLLKKHTRNKLAKPALYESSVWIKSLIPLVLHSGLLIVNAQVGVVLLGIMSKPEDVAIFKVAFQGATLLTFGLTTINAVLAPHIVNYHLKGKINDLQNILTFSIRVIFLISLPLLFVYIFWGDFFITLLFGKEYIDAYSVLVILSFGQIVNLGCGSVGLVMQMLGSEKKIVSVSFISLVINITLSLLLINNFGVDGAAYASAISIVYWNLALAIHVKKSLGIRSYV